MKTNLHEESGAVLLCTHLRSLVLTMITRRDLLSLRITELELLLGYIIPGEIQ